MGYASWRTLGYTLEHSAIQLRLASAYLADWKLNHHLGTAIHWVEKHHEVVADTPDSTLRAWTPYIVRQSDALFDADGDISIVLKLAESRHVRPDAPEAAPFRDVLEKYAVAIGEAHVSENPQILLDAARRAKRLLPSALLDQTLRTHRALTLEMMATVPDVADAYGIRVQTGYMGGTSNRAHRWHLLRRGTGECHALENEVPYGPTHRIYETCDERRDRGSAVP